MNQNMVYVSIDFNDAVFVNEVVASISHATLRSCDFSA